MTLDEFRQRWTSTAKWSDGAASTAPETNRLTFLPPGNAEIVPRLIFREGFVAPAVAPRNRTRPALWLRRSVLVVTAIGVTSALVVGMDRIFEYAPKYIETYLTPQN